MSLLDDLPLVLPAEMAAMYRAAWPSSDLLAEVTEGLASGDRVLLLGCAADALAPVLARRVSQGMCVVADDDAAAGQRLVDMAVSFGPAALRVLDPAILAAGAAAGSVWPFDAIVANVMFHSSKLMTLSLLRLAHAVSRPGASIIVGGAKDRGMLSITDEMRRLYGNVTVVAMRKGHRVVVSLRGGEEPADNVAWPGAETDATEQVTVRGERLALAPSPLVFANGRVDPAARLLAESMQIGSDETFVDLGCGAGVVGLVAGRLAPRGRVYLLDSSHGAVRTALQNAKRNGIGNVTALAGDGPAIMEACNLRPDVIATNPPFHVGQVEARQVAARFISASAQCLRPRGRLYVVANRFLAYETLLRAAFEQVIEVVGNDRFKVLRAERSASIRSNRE